MPQSIFCSGVFGRPSWFAALEPQFARLGMQCHWSPKAPHEGWDPLWPHWDQHAMEAKIRECGCALWLIEQKGVAHPTYQQELLVGRRLWQEGAIQGMVYVNVARPSYISHDAPPGIAEMLSLALQCFPGQIRTMIGPHMLPAFLDQRWVPSFAALDEEDAASEANDEDAVAAEESAGAAEEDGGGEDG